MLWRVSWRFCRHGAKKLLPFLLLCALGLGLGPLASCSPAWWRAGHARTVHRSAAEVELLSHLAVLLMPEEPIAELFRDFPAQRSEAWGSGWLCPDIAAHGLLRKAGAGLFIEYDGHYRHCSAQGCKADERKTDALLRYAPPGSCVLRLVHAERCIKLSGHSAEIMVDTWRGGQQQKLAKVVRQTVRGLLTRFKHELRPDIWQRLHSVPTKGTESGARHASRFAKKALFTAGVETRKSAVQHFLETEANLTQQALNRVACTCPEIWGLSIRTRLKPTVAWLKDVGLGGAQVAKVIAVSPQVLGYSIEGNLKPTVAWLKDVGLGGAQVAKVIVAKPQVLGLSIDGNLKPTVAWLKDVGLGGAQVAKVIAVFPSVLGLSIDGNLKPTMAWLKDVGLGGAQVAKVIAASPQVLGYSIEGNLKPTVAWLKDVGLGGAQVAKVIAVFPSVLGLSIDGNLKPTVAWLKDVGLGGAQVAKVIAVSPQVLGYSIEGNLKPTMAWLKDVGLGGAQVAKVIAVSPQVLGYSIEGNLKPTVEWLKHVGLSHPQIVTIIARFPPLLGLSVQGNLSRKWLLLERFFSADEICAMIVYLPQLLSCSYARILHRCRVLRQAGCLSKLASVMTLTESKFSRRFADAISGIGILDSKE